MDNNMKKLFILMIIFLSTNAFSLIPETIEESWITSNKEIPSCALYRKRVANYYQRISEVEFADKVSKGELREKDIARVLDIWSRAGLDILPNELVTFKKKMWMGDWSYYLNYRNSGYIKISSPFFNWESDTVTTPEDVFKVIPNEKEDNVTIEYTVTLAQACLSTSKLNVLFGIRIKDSPDATITIESNIDKYQWDLVRLKNL